MNYFVDVTVVLALIGLGFICVYLFKRFFFPDMKNAMAGVIFLCPAIFMAIKAGVISELSGAGYGVKFRHVQTQNVLADISQKKIKTLTFTGLDTSGEDSSLELAHFWGACTDFIVFSPDVFGENSPNGSIEVGVTRLAFVIHSSIVCGKFQGVVFVDKDKRYIGSFSKDSAIELNVLAEEKSEIDSQSDHGEPVDLTFIYKGTIKQLDFNGIAQNPRERIASGEGFSAVLGVNATTENILEKFQNEEVDFIVVTNAYGRVQGIITRKGFSNFIFSEMIK